MTERFDETRFDSLVAHAHEVRVVVIGGGVAGLVAARECAKVGMRVTVLEAAEHLGGVVHPVVLGGVTLDAGAESYADRGGAVDALLDDLGLAGDVVRPSGGAAWIAGIPGRAPAPIPGGGVLGIPANPWDPAVRRVIGWRGAWRAYLDRLRPPLTIGHERSLGALVRSRMGAAVHDRLVAPVTSGVYSARPVDIDVDLAAPGLSAALTRTGSLAGAVGQLRGGSTTAPGAAVAGVEGGMWRMVAALRDRLVERGVDVRTGARVAAIESAADGAGAPWLVRVAPAPGGGDPLGGGADPVSSSSAPEIPSDPTEDVGADVLEADVVIVATEERPARELLSAVVPALDAEAAASPEVEVVTLLLDAPALDAAPRGNGVLTVPGSHAAKALTHSTAKWAWVADLLPARHVVRVSFGAQGEPPATASLDDDAAASMARSEASALLGVELDADSLVAAHRARFAQSQPAATIGRPLTTAAARGAVAAVPGLAVVGAWVAGTGLAQVVPDAIAETDRVRRAALWRGDDTGAGAGSDT